MKKKTVLIICFNTLHNDPRVLRQIKILKDQFTVVAAGFSDPMCDVSFVQLEEYRYKMIDFFFDYPWLFRKFFAFFTLIYLKASGIYGRFLKKVFMTLPFTRFLYFEKEYWKLMKKHFLKLKNISADVIIANDIDTLPLAFKLKRSSSKLVFDAHEYHPMELEELEWWRKSIKPKIEYMCGRYIKEADLMFTVSDPIANEYKKNFKVEPVVITNAPAFVQLKPTEPGEHIRLIHHGGAIKERLLEETIGVMEYLDNNYSLDLMLIGSDSEYLSSLKEKYKDDVRISFKDPVPTQQISKTINQYDIGIYILPPLNFNNINALPNKFFEFIQGRLMVAIAPMPAMAEIVKKYNLGVVAGDYSSKALADAIKKLSREEIYKRKKSSDTAAMELSEETNKQVLLNEIKKLLN